MALPNDRTFVTTNYNLFIREAEIGGGGLTPAQEQQLNDADSRSQQNETDITTLDGEVTTIDGQVTTLEFKEINALDYGVVGDGVADDTAAIQAALDAGGARMDAGQALSIGAPSLIYLPGGSYRITSPLTVRNGTTLIGDTYNPPYPTEVAGFGSNENRFTGTVIVVDSSFSGGDYAIEMEADNVSVENIILIGFEIPCGSTFGDIQLRTQANKFNQTNYIPFYVADPADFRQAQLRFENIEVPYFRIGQEMEYYLQATGGDGDYTFSLVSGSLPAGLSLDPDGRIHGTATAPYTGVNEFPTFRVTDGALDTADKVYTMRAILDEIDTREELLPLTAATDYSYQLQTLYGESVTWESLDLPSFLSLNSVTGELTALAASTNNATVDFYKFLISIRDNTSGLVLETKPFELEVRFEDDSIEFFADYQVNPSINTAFSNTYLASGGYNDFTYSINDTRSNAETGNSQPVTPTSPYPGLTLNTATGEISGTALVTGRNIFYLRATSNVDTGIFREDQFVVNVEGEGDIPKLITRSLPTATVGQPYSYQIKAETIVASQPYTYDVINLPTGLTFDANTGIISGTPTGASFIGGIRTRWSCSVRNCTIRGFRSGAGINSIGASNIHRHEKLNIAVCDTGLTSTNQTFDSHYTDMFIYNCRIGIDFGPGSAGISIDNTRVEFIHHWGLQGQLANENDFRGVYFDTCGWNSVYLWGGSKNNIFTGCRFFRSGRTVRGVGTRRYNLADPDFSSHVRIVDSPRNSFVGCTMDIGSNTEGDGLFFQDESVIDCARPAYGMRLRNAKELSVVGNNMTGIAKHPFSVDANLFGQNDFTGYNIGNNALTDIYGRPTKQDTLKTEFYIPNGGFQIWQRDNAFVLPPSAAAVGFEICDQWRITRGDNTVIDQNISVTRGTDAPVADGFYVNVSKPLNTTTPPGNNFQRIELTNNYITNIEKSSNRVIVVSFYGRSPQNNTINVRIGQYADSADNGFFAFQSLEVFNFDEDWRRYQFTLELDNLDGINFGANTNFELRFELSRYDEVIDADFAGCQIDLVEQGGFALDYRKRDFNEELAYAQRLFQSSLEYDTSYLASWSENLRYDVSGDNFPSGYASAFAPSTDANFLSASINFFVTVPEKFPNADSVAGVIPGLKILNPESITDQTSPTKYSFGFDAVNKPTGYFQHVDQNGFTVTGRGGGTVTLGNVYGFHWVYTAYAQDTAAGGGYA